MTVLLYVMLRDFLKLWSLFATYIKLYLGNKNPYKWMTLGLGIMVESKSPNKISIILIWCFSRQNLDASKWKCRKPKIIQSNNKQNEYRRVLITVFARAWAEFHDERALWRPGNLQTLSREQIFAHLHLHFVTQVTKSGCLFSFPLIIPYL